MMLTVKRREKEIVKLQVKGVEGAFLSNDLVPSMAREEGKRLCGCQ